MTREEAIKIISTIYEGQIKDNFKLEMHESVYVEIDKAFNIAIRSLEAWNKIYRQIKTEVNPYGKPTKDYETGIWIMNLIEKHLKEVEE